jgi:hypothetical protein
MKKIIGLLTVTILILTGCGFEDAKNSYLEAGYTENTTLSGNSALYKEFGENGYINLVYEEEDFIAIYASYGTDNKWTYVESDIKTGDNICGTVVDESNKSANCKDVYAYIKLKNNELMNEMIKLYDTFNIDYAINSTGDATVISDIIEEKISISNLRVSNSDYTNQFMEEDFVNGEDFVSVSFDVTNLAYKSGFELNDLSYGAKLCYTVDTGEKCSLLSSFSNEDYSSVSDEVVGLNNTKTVNFTAVAPINAENYYIKIDTYDSEGNELIYESEKVGFNN